METYHVPHNVKVLGNVVETFPAGIGEAFDALIKMLPEGDKRLYYGISWCSGNDITYIAAAEQKTENEATQFGCKIYIIEKGDYLCIPVYDWRRKTASIKNVFEEIMKDARADNKEPAIEIYKNEKEMFCLVKMRQSIETLKEFDNTLNALLQVIESFDTEQINTIPFQDSWTAAQVASHVTKSNSSIAQAMKLQGATIERDADERVQELKDMFLDFAVKFKSPEFILPTQDIYDRDKLIAALKGSVEQLKEASNEANLSEAIKHPAFGEITKLELLHFVLFHMQRHTRQLKNISGVIRSKQQHYLQH
jgi:hypothetical protein